jgi:peptide/nickel transport system permease protein
MSSRIRGLMLPGRTESFAVVVLGATCVLAFAMAALPHRIYGTIDLSMALQPPSMTNPMGTDSLGRSVLMGLAEGASVTVGVVIVTVGVSSVIGVVLGLVAGYVGGVIDYVVTVITDILLVFPSIILALAIISVLGAGLTNAVIAMTVAQIGPYARLVRGLVLPAKELPFVENARSIGVHPVLVVLRHVLPYIGGPILVQMTFATGVSILGVAGLGFLGVGAQPPTADWGTMLYEGRSYLTAAPHTVVFPGLAIFLVVFSANVVGEALRDRLDPRTRTRVFG